MIKKNYCLLALFTFIASTVPQSITPMHTSGNLPLLQNAELFAPKKFSLSSLSPSSFSFLKPSLSWIDKTLSAGIWALKNPYANTALMLGIQGIGGYLVAWYGWHGKPASQEEIDDVGDYTKKLGYANWMKNDKDPAFNVCHSFKAASVDTTSRWHEAFDPDVYEVSYNSLYLPHGRTDVKAGAKPVLRAIALSRLSQHWIKRDLVPLLGRATFGLVAQMGINFFISNIIKKTSTLNNAFIDLGVQTLSFSGSIKAQDYAGDFINNTLLGWYNRWVRTSAENNALEKLTQSFETKTPHVKALNLKAYKEWLEKIKSKQLCFTKRAIVNQLIFKEIITGTYTPAEIQALCLSTELLEKIAHDDAYTSKTALLKEIEDLTGDKTPTNQENIYNAVKKWWQTTTLWNSITKDDFWTLSLNASEHRSHYFPATPALQNRIDAIDTLLEKECIKNVLVEEEEEEEAKKIDAILVLQALQKTKYKAPIPVQQQNNQSNIKNTQKIDLNSDTNQKKVLSSQKKTSKKNKNKKRNKNKKKKK